MLIVYTNAVRVILCGTIRQKPTRRGSGFLPTVRSRRRSCLSRRRLQPTWPRFNARELHWATARSFSLETGSPLATSAASLLQTLWLEARGNSQPATLSGSGRRALNNHRVMSSDNVTIVRVDTRSPCGVSNPGCSTQSQLAACS